MQHASWDGSVWSSWEARPQVYENTQWNINPSSKNKRRERSASKALYLMNIKSALFGVLSLKSYYSPWFICRCTSPFDVLSWEVLHLLEKKEVLWKQQDLPDSQKKPATDRRFVLPWCTVHVSFTKRLPSCFDTLRLVQQNNFFVEWNPCFPSCVCFGMCIKSIACSFKMRLERVLLWRCFG